MQDSPRCWRDSDLWPPGVRRYERPVWMKKKSKTPEDTPRCSCDHRLLHLPTLRRRRELDVEAILDDFHDRLFLRCLPDIFAKLARSAMNEYAAR